MIRFIGCLEFHAFFPFKFIMQGRRRGGNQSTLSPVKLHYTTERGESDDSDWESNCFSDAGLIALGECFTKLKKLSLIWCSNVTSMGLQSFAEQCRSLRSLDLQVNLYSSNLKFSFNVNDKISY